MSQAASTATLRTLLDKRLSQFSAELEHELRRQFADELNQISRRLAQCTDFDELSHTLTDAALAFCNSAAVFAVSGNIVRGASVRGLDSPDIGAQFGALEISVSNAAAFAGVIGSKEPAVAMGSAAEVSAPVAELFRHSTGDRVAVVPIAAGGEIRGLLYACGPADLGGLELLAQIASLALAARETPPASPGPPGGPELVQIRGGKPEEPAPAAASDWRTLSSSEQQQHLRAQRFARVQVAEMRLYRPDEVKAGRARGDLYQTFQDSIDRARDVFRQTYLWACPSMVDYLHLELVRTLANDDARLLGPRYPGPLV